MTYDANRLETKSRAVRATETASELFRQIVELERAIESGAAKGKLTATKAAHRKLSAAYVRAYLAEQGQ